MLVSTPTTPYIFKQEWDCFITTPVGLSEGECEELIAYYNGEPVTERIVSRVRDLVVKRDTPPPLEFKSLGEPVIRCTDGAFVGVDMGTLLRHFDYISDLYELDPYLREIKLPFSLYELIQALRGVGHGNYREMKYPKIRSCLECAEYLRPKNSSYYLRYQWDLWGDLSLKLDNGRVIPKEDVFKFMKFIGSSLPTNVRMYRGSMSRLVMDYDLYPIVEIAFSERQTRWLRLLLSHLPSALLYCAYCVWENEDFGCSPITILLEGDFENESPCYSMEGWFKHVQAHTVSFLAPDYLENVKEEDRHRLLASFGFRSEKLGNVNAKAIRPFSMDLPVDTTAIAITLHARNPTWMTPEMRAYFEGFFRGTIFSHID